MIELKSVSKPSLAADAAVAFRESVTEGKPGAIAVAPSPSALRYVGLGKGSRIQRRPPAGHLAVEAVIGTDDRILIDDTQLDPWRMICALRMEGPDGGNALGTGWLAGPKTVITAGHCVHSSTFFGGWAARIRVLPAYNAGERPYGEAVGTRFSAIDRWISDEDPDFDVGCIHLDEPIGTQTGWFGFAALSPTSLAQAYANIAGYPADRASGERLYFHKNRILRTTERRVFYDVDTFGGQSGAPVWIVRPNQPHPLVVAIHAYGTGATPSHFGIEANSAPRIIPELHEIIAGWLDE